MATKEEQATIVNGHPGANDGPPAVVVRGPPPRPAEGQAGPRAEGLAGPRADGQAGPRAEAQVGPRAEAQAGPRAAEPNCCLLENGKRCPRPASNASYSKRIQGTVAQRKLRLAMDSSAQHIYICDYHKSVIQTVRTKRKRRESEDSGEEAAASGAGPPPPPPTQQQVAGGDMVDLFQLQMNTLRRYKNHFKVTSRPGLNKAQLADSLSRHFHSLPVIEKEAITYFLYMVKTGQSRLDQPGGKQFS